MNDKWVKKMKRKERVDGNATSVAVVILLLSEMDYLEEK